MVKWSGAVPLLLIASVRVSTALMGRVSSKAVGLTAIYGSLKTGVWLVAVADSPSLLVKVTVLSTPGATMTCTSSIYQPVAAMTESAVKSKRSQIGCSAYAVRSTLASYQAARLLFATQTGV